MRSIGILLSLLSGMAVSCSEARFLNGVSGIERASSKLEWQESEEVLLKKSDEVEGGTVDGGGDGTTIVEDGSDVDLKTGCAHTYTESKIDFENLASGTLMSDQLKDQYGIEFSAATGTPVINTATHAGDAELPAASSSWICGYCPGAPTRNRLWDAAAQQAVGRRFLTTTSSFTSKTASVDITWVEPVDKLQFDLIDVDGGESWVIDVYDENGTLIPDSRQTISEDGYAHASTNGRPVTIEFAFDQPKISKLTLRGRKAIRIFGFAFDNFYTGISSCKDK
jgi:hypothetical protein